MTYKQIMSSIFIIIFLMMPTFQAMAQTDSDGNYNITSIQSKGNQISGGHFTGTVWVDMIVDSDDGLDSRVGIVTFEPKARADWHIHPGGQILIVTDGVGYYQEKGKPIQVIRGGDVVKCPAGVEHWHGGSHEQSMTHTAILPNMNKGSTEWLEPVTDKEYEMVGNN